MTAHGAAQQGPTGADGGRRGEGGRGVVSFHSGRELVEFGNVTMWLHAWLLWAGLLHTWAECARHTEPHPGGYLCAAERGSRDGRSKQDHSRESRERAGVGHGHGPLQRQHPQHQNPQRQSPQHQNPQHQSQNPQHQHQNLPNVPPHKIRRMQRRKGWKVRAEEQEDEAKVGTGTALGPGPGAEAVPRILHHPADVVVKVGEPTTLSCRAQGTPEPTVQWLRNGQPLETQAGRDDRSRVMVLSDGSLFFLSVGAGGGRRGGQTHEGVYTCVARNGVGVATSRNATLYIAGEEEEEEEEERCAERDLTIDPSEKQHSGVYVCVASNTVGVRESRAARLSVLARPVLLQRPENVTVRPGESASFYCQARGDPAPAVEWSREQGPLPNGRYLVSPDQSLQVHYVTVQDAGRYTCTAVNDIGTAVASAHLIVEDAGSTKQKDLHKELSALRVDKADSGPALSTIQR
ncbi:hypothetical protein CRUP_025768 [Coryphaenoides rupestris]|nr:hypothetical protein CRUP_025768 [Coryphaenoides rupestris]